MTVPVRSIVIGSILGHGLYYWLIQKTTPAFPSTWFYVSPFISLVLDIWIQKERFHPLSILGRIIILAGVYLMNGQAVRHAFLKRQKSFAS
jgi:drug/metabolite transporter (DMT)-like permease